MPGECRPLLQRFEHAEELQFAGIECFFEGLQEEPAEQRRQDPNGQEEVRPAGNPAIAAR
jgi:hypothetical protein